MASIRLGVNVLTVYLRSQPEISLQSNNLDPKAFLFITMFLSYKNPGARFTNCYAHNSNSIEISSRCNSVACDQIATTFCSDHRIRIKVRVKQNFHRIWIAMEKPFVWCIIVRSRNVVKPTRLVTWVIVSHWNFTDSSAVETTVIG